MATKKAPPAPAAKKPAATGGGAVVLWQEEMAAAAKKQVAQEKPINSVATISTRGGVLSVDGDPVKGNALNLVVLGAVYENAYYPGRFDPDNPQAPVCYALASEDADTPEEDMAPHDEAEDPQADACANCEKNVMGSADTGRGKACKNVRRLVVVAQDALQSAEDMKTSEMRVLKIPVTSVRNWAGYVRGPLAELGRPYFGVVTTVSCTPDAKTQYKVLFEVAETIDFTPDLYAALKVKRADAAKLLSAPYPKNADLEAARAAKAPPKGQRMVPQGRVAQKAVASKGRKF